ncbi:DgyrCDS9223 [Dimorphilus gyrociliatus]|nr:DgyrCDS9223 [Dimorphilus gyrociliatus]
MDSIFYCVIKILPIISLMIFVLLHGMNFSEAYVYSRRILIGLLFSAFGDAFMVWKKNGYFIPAVGMFAIAQLLYARAFGFRDLKIKHGVCCGSLCSVMFLFLLPVLEGKMVWIGMTYCALICGMLWRAVARVQLFNDLWTWTKLCSCGGAIFFVISDYIICLDKFLAPVPYAHQLIMSTYYTAQLGITLSVIDSQADIVIEQSLKETENWKTQRIEKGSFEEKVDKNCKKTN